MNLISVNVGLPREIIWKGRQVTTGIYKEPVAGRVAARKENLDGDRQADLTVHGGLEKAIYAYPSEHYDFWRRELSEVEFVWGKFGENFTTEGLSEELVNIGDRFHIGSATVLVTQPRLPCYKLAARFNRDDIIKRFLQSGRTGLYFSVEEEGIVGAGDKIALISRDESNVTVADVVRLYLGQSKDLDLMIRAARLEALPAGWRKHFQQQLGDK